MNIPPQLYIVLQRGVTIETCPSCSRIIYWEEIMKDKDDGTAWARGEPPTAGERLTRLDDRQRPAIG